jgi:hypothetical protein
LNPAHDLLNPAIGAFITVSGPKLIFQVFLYLNLTTAPEQKEEYWHLHAVKGRVLAFVRHQGAEFWHLHAVTMEEQCTYSVFILKTVEYWHWHPRNYYSQIILSTQYVRWCRLLRVLHFGSPHNAESTKKTFLKNYCWGGGEHGPICLA